MLNLSPDDIYITRLRYQKRYKCHGHDQQSVGWGKKGRQIERFRILSSLTNMHKGNQYNILDIGAGFGDLFPYLSDAGFDISSYLGFELVRDLYDQGVKTYGHHSNFRLINDDFLKFNADTPMLFDHGFMSGCFNFKLLINDNYDYIHSTLRKALDLCSTSVVANFITDRVDYMEDYIFYCDPKRIIDIAYKISRRFVIDHSYFPYEFSLAIFQDQSYDSDYPVFNDQRFN
jgi:hypothetical protein